MQKTVLILLLTIAAINCISQPKERKGFTVRFTLTAVTITKGYDIEGKLESRRETEDHYTVKQGLWFNRELLKRLESKTQRIDLCSSESMCVLLTGDSRALGANQPVTYTTKSTGWSKCNEKLVQTSQSQGGGTLTDYVISSGISVIQRPKGDELPDAVPLTRNRHDLTDIEAAPLVNPHYYIRLFVNVGGFTPNINPEAPKLQTKTFECYPEPGKWISNAPDTRYGLSVPDFGVLRRISRGSKDELMLTSYIEPVFNEKALVDFLRTPSKGKTFLLKGRSYSKTEQEEVQTDIYIELQFE